MIETNGTFSPPRTIIVDIGAQGFPRHSYGYTRSSYEEYYLFEPHPGYFSKLKKLYGDNPQYKLYDIALYNKKGTTTFYETPKKNCSSLLEPNKEVLHDRPDIHQYTTMEVKTDLMDNILGDLDYIDYMKLDTQGSEYEIFLGGINTLKKTKRIQCEVEHAEMYKNQKLYEDIKQLLKDNGFKETKIEKAGKHHSDAWFENTNLI